MKYLITSVAVVGLGFLIILAKSLSNNDLVSNDTFIVLLVISIAFVVCLFLLIIFQVFKLLQSVRKEITGSKLTLRLVISFGLMVLIPVSIVYLVSVNFLTKSIESWFDVRVESALEGGLNLGQKTIDILIDDIELKGKSIAYAIANKPYEKREDILIDLREKFSISSAVLYKNDGSISAISESNPTIKSTTISLEDIRRVQNGYFVLNIPAAKKMNIKLLIANQQIKNFDAITKTSQKPENLLLYTNGGKPQYAQKLITNITKGNQPGAFKVDRMELNAIFICKLKCRKRYFNGIKNAENGLNILVYFIFLNFRINYFVRLY